jgi:hypothetical protein
MGVGDAHITLSLWEMAEGRVLAPAKPFPSFPFTKGRG